MNYPKRKYPRLKNFDYAAGGVFCVTICTKGKQHCLGMVVDGEEARVQLSPVGTLVQRQIDNIPNAYPGVKLLNRVVMPNHAHILLQIPEENARSLLTVIRSTKTMTTRALGYSLWQPSFYEHIVRDERDALRFWRYIEENPKKWTLDPYFE